MIMYLTRYAAIKFQVYYLDFYVSEILWSD